MHTLKKISPPFKYIGGKSWLQKELCNLVEKQLVKKSNINSYIEPFCGGLGAFLSVRSVLLNHNIKKIQLNDINGNMINLYKFIQNDVNDILEKFNVLEQQFKNKIDMLEYNKSKEKENKKIILKQANEFFIEQRALFNNDKNIFSKEQAVRFLFLQKHSFNGIYRENLKGLYNSPFNWSEKIINQEYVDNLKNLSNVFNQFNIIFTNKSFDEFEYENNTLIYLDPPYINVDIGENKYNKDHFSIKEQKKLIKKIKNHCFIYSNHKNEIILQEFIDQNIMINIQNIERSNIISSKADGRKNKIEEILVNSI